MGNDHSCLGIKSQTERSRVVARVSKDGIVVGMTSVSRSRVAQSVFYSIHAGSKAADYRALLQQSVMLAHQFRMTPDAVDTARYSARSSISETFWGRTYSFASRGCSKFRDNLIPATLYTQNSDPLESISQNFDIHPEQ